MPEATLHRRAPQSQDGCFAISIRLQKPGMLQNFLCFWPFLRISSQKARNKILRFGRKRRKSGRLVEATLLASLDARRRLRVIVEGRALHQHQVECTTDPPHVRCKGWEYVFGNAELWRHVAVLHYACLRLRLLVHELTEAGTAEVDQLQVSGPFLDVAKNHGILGLDITVYDVVCMQMLKSLHKVPKQWACLVFGQLLRANNVEEIFACEELHEHEDGCL
mmetsp:Transcript_125142/g.176661  ORF Transcript_125142/g.176661 Transcript_125142/m.176661 type:complete len:221 (-) Transcript_125142:275-937(-)